MRKFLLTSVREFLRKAAAETPASPTRTAEQIAEHLGCSTKTVLNNMQSSMFECIGVKYIKPGTGVRMGQPERWVHYPTPGVLEGNPPRTPTMDEHEACIAGMREALAAAGVTYDEAKHYARQQLPMVSRRVIAQHGARARNAHHCEPPSSLAAFLDPEPAAELNSEPGE